MIILDKSAWDKSLRLTQYCFRDNSGDFTRWYYERRTERVFALMDDQGSVTAQVLDSRVRISVRGCDVVSSLISHVATDPAHRSKGMMWGLLTDALRKMRVDGVALAALYPSAYSFYERYGFAACGQSARVVIHPDRLRAKPLVNRLCWDTVHDVGALTECYAAAHSKVSGALVRSTIDMRDRIDDLTGDGASVVTLCRGNKIMGYWFRRDEDSAMIIDECAFRDASARADFLSYIASHASTSDEAQIRIPSFDPLLRMLPDRYASVTVEPWAMFRVVDLPGLSRGLTAGTGCVTLRVVDDQMPDNTGLWRFEALDGSISVSRARIESGIGACTLGIGAVTQWLIGSADGSALMETGQPLTPDTACAMDALLPARRVFLWEQC
ncbi:MAG: GNAT family N-acetyltransferase [Oscillospiraceae bacterium]|nr:GNAT family N-acetyltransferase [Oscillospiraceae bacterium]